MAKRTLVNCGWIVSMDPDVGDLKDAQVLIEDDRIAAVGANLAAEADEVIDARDMIAMPGLINAHLHTWQTGLKAVGSDWVSADYHKNMHANMATRFNAEDTYLGNLYGALGQIDNGTTTLFDWCHNLRDLEMAERALDGLEEAGIRAVFGHGTAKPPAAEGETPYTHVPHPRDRIEHLRGNRLTSNDRLVTLAMAILGPEFGTFDVAVQDMTLAKELDLLSTAHVWHGFNRNIPEDADTNDPYLRMADMGLLGPKHNIVHGNYMQDDHIRRVVDEGCSITSTVLCESHSHGGAPLTGRVRELGGQPSIGTDTTTLVAEDMFGEMRGALFQLRAQSARLAREAGDYPLTEMPVNAREALHWATMGNARALCMEDRIGSLTPGKKADVVFLRADDTALFPVHDPVFAIVEQATGANVAHVIIDGEFRRRDGERLYPKAQYAALREKLVASAERLMTESNYRPKAA